MGWETNKPTTEDIKSWIGLAAKYQNETVAIITLDRVAGDKRYNDNNRKLQDFLKDFGEIFAAHIETYFLKRNKEIIQGITKHMGEKLTTKDLINNILLKLQEGLKTDNFNYFSVAYNCDEKKRYLQELTSVNNSSNQEQSKKPCAYIEGIGIAGLVLQDGKSRIIPNAAEDDGFVASFKHRGEKLSLLAIAVKPNPNSNRIIGVISCYKQETDYFTVYDRHLLEQVTNVTATLIERTITLENLNEISQKMSELVLIRNKTELLKTICQKALEMTSAGSASIHLLDYDKENSQNEDCYKGYTVNKTTPPYTSPENSEKSPRLNRKGVTDYIIDHVGDKIDSFIFDKNHELDRVSQDDQNPKIVSKLVVPLKIIENKQQRLIGALYLNKYSDENFSDVELFALELLGKQAASVIKDQRILWEKTFIANARQKLTEAIKTVANHTELDLLLKDIARYAYELIQINEFPSKESAQEEFFCFVDMLKTDRKPEVTVAWPEYHLTQLRGKRNECNNKQENKKGIIGLVIDKKETIVISDIQDKNGEDYKKYGDDYIEYSPKTHSELVVPITVEEKIEGKNEKKVIGVINLEHSQPNKFIKLHREVIEHFASQVAIAYQKEKLAETINKSNKVLTRLHQSLPRIMSEPVENLLYEAVSSARNALSVEEFIVLLFSDSKPDWEKMVPSSTLFKNPKNDLKKISIISINVYGGKNDKPIENTLKFGDPPVHDGLCLLFADGPNKRGVVWIIFPNNIDQNLIKENEEIYKVYVSQIALAYGNAKRFEKFNNKDKDDLSEEIKTDLKRARQESVLWFLISIISSVLGIVFIGYGVCFWLIASGFILGQDNQPQVQSNENQNPVAKQGKAKAETPPAESQTANLSIILGLIIQAVPILAFKQATEANKRLENYHQERINIGKLSLLLAATRQLSFDYPDEQKSDAHDGAKKIIELAANSWLQVANFDKDKDTGKTNILESLTNNLPSLTKETKDSSENNQPSNK
jgi:GAF domain-containing protein